MFMSYQVFGDSLSHGVWPGQHRPLWSSDGQSMVVRAAVRDGVEGPFMHIMLVTTKQVPLTLGTFTVNRILAWDTARQLV